MQPNIVWILVDSIRTYPTRQDPRGKLPFMEHFGRGSVEFTTCVTTAPSTIMSITAMMTGLPAYTLARNYDQFQFDAKCHDSLAGVLKRLGYESYAFLRGPETREKFKNLLDPVSRKYWPRHLRHRFKWKNQDLMLLLERVLQSGISRPAFLFFHYNPQTRKEIDWQLSDRVARTWYRLLKAGFTSDNTIFILCSDHGFPDPSTGMTTEWEVRYRLSHDLILTDDNILIPLYIRCPGVQAKTITTPVSSLDIFPTLLDLIGAPEANEIKQRIDGRSLMPLIRDGETKQPSERFFRSDSRLMFQSGRCTAIRSRDWKYVRFHDEHRIMSGGHSPCDAEILIDLRHDPLERANVLRESPVQHSTQSKLLRFRAEFERSERRALQFQTRYLLARLKGRIAGRTKSRRGESTHLLIVFEPDAGEYVRVAAGAIHGLFPDLVVDVVVERGTAQHGAIRLARRIFEYEVSPRDSTPTCRALSAEGGPSGYDLMIFFLQNPSSPIAKGLLRVMRCVSARRRLVIDCNFDFFRRKGYWYYRLRQALRKLPYMVEEPWMIVSQIHLAGRLLTQHLLRKWGRWERWQGLSTGASVHDE